MTEKQFKITDEFDDCFYIREKDNEVLTTAKDFENKLNEQYEIIQHLKQIQDSLWTTEHIRKLEKENEQLKSENNMLKVTIGRNEAYIKRLTETSEWHC